MSVQETGIVGLRNGCHPQVFSEFDYTEVKGFCSLVDILDKVNAVGEKEIELTVSKTLQGLTLRTDKEFLQINHNKAEIAIEVKMSKGYEREITSEGASPKLTRI